MKVNAMYKQEMVTQVNMCRLQIEIECIVALLFVIKTAFHCICNSCVTLLGHFHHTGLLSFIC